MAKKHDARARVGIPAGYGFVAVVLALVVSLGLVIAVRRNGARLVDSAAFAANPEAASEEAAAPPVGVVDSVFPIEEEIRRFRVDLPEVTEITGGASSRDELVDRFVHALERADTVGLAGLLLSRAEFGWLYYPHTMYTARPYELSPALLWFQMQNLTSTGLAHVLKRSAEGPLNVKGYRCEETPTTEGPNRVWSECKVILQPPGAEPIEMQLFGSILERGGAYKFVSYASDA